MITSPANEKVRYLRSLYRRHIRQQERHFVVEGVRLFEDALRAGVKPTLVLYDPETLSKTPRGSELLRQLEQWEADSFAATTRVIAAASETVTPQGVVAAVPFSDFGSVPDYSPTLLLVLDGLQDPGNLGTILRSAEAAGVSGVLLSADTVDPFNPKVVRAGMGAHFRLPLFPDLSWEEIAAAVSGLCQVRAAEVGDHPPYFLVDWTKPSALVIGNEAQGLSQRGKDLATEFITIPMIGGVESLNASVAASVIIF
jgi:RNA methyltransferase, TrmH family